MRIGHGTRLGALVTGLLASIAVLAAIAGAAQAAPPNDHYGNAIEFGSAPGEVVGTNVDATRQTGEPENGNATVWWKWTAPDSARYRLDTCETLPSLSLVVGVFTGPNVSTLTEPVTAPSYCPGNGELDALAFDAVAGTTYRFSVGEYFSGGDGSQNIRLNLRRTPLNDNFAAATEFPVGIPSVTGTNVEATRESGEPENGHSTVWWRWVAPTSDVYKLDLCGTVPPFSSYLGVYTGAAVNQLQEPAVERSQCPGEGAELDRLAFTATAGGTYYFSVANYFSGSDVFSQNIVLGLKSQACLNARKATSKAKDKVEKAQKKVEKAKKKVEKAKSQSTAKEKKAKKALKKAKKKLKNANGNWGTAKATQAAAC